ncbi:MAG: hypothetical protein IK130_12350 [Oscillospiraceae bacterium]|nr:hypothetical protein [Oscillospiraceae bacterium]
MTGLLTDDVRRERYAVLQEERIRCEKQFDRCGTFLAYAAAADVIGNIIMIAAIGLVTPIGNELLICIPLSLVIYALIFTGISDRMMLRAVIGAALAVLRIILVPFSFFVLAVIPILASLLAIRKWETLSKEEGFPEFDISFDERGKCAAQTVRNAEYE